MSDRDRFIFSFNPYFPLASYASRCMGEEAHERDYRNGLVQASTGMSLAELARLRIWSPVPHHPHNIFDELSYRYYQPSYPVNTQTHSAFLATPFQNRVLDLPDIGGLPTPHPRLIVPMTASEYVIVNGNTPYLTSIRSKAPEESPQYPSRDASILHIAVADPCTKTLVATDTTGLVFFSSIDQETIEPLMQVEGTPSGLLVCDNVVYVCVDNTLSRIDLRDPENRETIRLAFSPTIIQQAASPDQLLIASQNTLLLVDIRQKIIVRIYDFLTPITAITRKASMVFVATINPSQSAAHTPPLEIFEWFRRRTVNPYPTTVSPGAQLSVLSSGLELLESEQATSPITDILCAPTRDVVVTLHESPECQTIGVWEHSKQDRLYRVFESGRSSFSSGCHGAIASDESSLGAVFPEEQCVCFWNLSKTCT